MAKSDDKKSTKKTKAKKGGKSLLKNLQGKFKASRKELISQVDQLSNEIAEFKNNNSSKKVIKKLEKKYKKQITNLKNEFNEQLDKLEAMQSKLMDSIPKDVLQKLHLADNETPTEKSSKKKASSTEVKPKVKLEKSELSRIKGIGPVTLKKLQAAGISTLDDLVNTPRNKVEVLKTFEKTNGFDSWIKQAKDLKSKD